MSAIFLFIGNKFENRNFISYIIFVILKMQKIMRFSNAILHNVLHILGSLACYKVLLSVFLVSGV